MADLPKSLGIPALLVVGMRLGCLNHALLTKQAIEASGVELAGWVANAIDPKPRASRAEPGELGTDAGKRAAGGVPVRSGRAAGRSLG